RAQDLEGRSSPRLLGDVLGVGGDRHLASVPLGRGQVSRGEDANAHDAHVLVHAAGKQAVEVGRVPARAGTGHGCGVEQVVVDLSDVEATAADDLVQRLRIAEAGETDPVAQAATAQPVHDVGDAALAQDLLRIEAALVPAGARADHDAAVQDEHRHAIEAQPP